jgi:hypothetical protein
VRSIIESTILRPGSIAVDEWGAPVVKQLLDAWFDRGEGPTQVVGALFVFESYHAGLPAQLAAPVVDATRHNLVISELHA